jgi:hypothetical protein
LGFCSLQHTSGSKVHFSRALPARLGPSSGFGCPLDGLLPAIPSRFCFAPAALMGLPLRSLPCRQVSGCFHTDGPTYRFACRCSRALGRRAGPAGRGSWALSLPEVPQTSRGFSTSADGSSPGFHPSRACHQSLGRDFAQPPVSRFPGGALRLLRAAPHSFDKLRLSPALIAWLPIAPGADSPHRVSAPVRP